MQQPPEPTDTERLDWFAAHAPDFRYLPYPTMGGQYPCWSVNTREKGRVMRKSLREAIDLHMPKPVLWEGTWVKPCLDCGVSATCVDNCGMFGNPDCPRFGIGREEYYRRLESTTKEKQPGDRDLEKIVDEFRYQ